MKSFYFILLITCCSISLGWIGKNDFDVKGKRIKAVDFCKIYGTVYYESNRNQADFSIFIEESEGFADLLVFEQDAQAYADGPGLWYETESKVFADHIIYLEKDKAYADFTIFYTDLESFAGCNN